MAHEWDTWKARAWKRGGQAEILPLDEVSAEGRYRHEPVDRLDPEQVYERGWALTLLEGALERLREEQAAAGRAKEFERLTGFLRGEQPKIPYRDVAAELGISEAAVKVSLHRLRQRFGTLLREAIGETVTSPQEVDDRPLRPVLVLRPGAVPSHIPNVLPARGRALLRLRGGARRRGRGGGAAPRTAC